MLLKEVVSIFEKVKAENLINKKILILSDFFRKLNPYETKICFSLLSGIPLYGKLNVGYSILKEVISNVRDFKSKEDVFLEEVDDFLKRLKEIKGEGSVKERYRILKDFFKKLDEKERKFMFYYLLGEVRQGAKEKLIFKGLLKAKDIDLKEEEKLLKKGNILELVHQISQKGKEILKDIKYRIFEPLLPMLAQIEEEPLNLFKKGKPYLLEFKMDGARLQIHKEKDEVKIFTRNLKDVTDKLPHLKNFFKKFSDDFILDSEAVILRGEKVLPFQEFMKEFGRKRTETEDIKPFIFDILYKNGEFLFDYPLKERIKILEDTIPRDLRMPYIISDNKEEAEKFYNFSIEKGNEGLLIKEIMSPYTAGKRGKYWFKWKKFYTLDLVITGAEWGHGRRRGFLSNLHLACLDEKRENFLDLGKTFKGLKDDDLKFLTENLPKYKTEDYGWMIKVKPVFVVEIAFDEVVESKKYSSGFSLRFARIKRFRFDKNVNEIADIGEIRRIFEMERRIK